MLIMHISLAINSRTAANHEKTQSGNIKSALKRTLIKENNLPEIRAELAKRHGETGTEEAAGE